MKDSAKRARIMLTLGGLNYLIKDGGQSNISRKHFFLTSNEAPDAVMMKEHSSKAWQIAVLDRFINAGILKQETNSHEICYYLTDIEKARNVVADHENGGLLLSHYLFPNEVPAPDAITTAIDLPAELPIVAKFASESEALASEEKLMDATDLLEKLLQAVVALKDQSKFSSTSIVDGIAIAFKEFNIVNNDKLKILDELPAAFKNTDSRLNGLSKRIDDLESVIKGQRNILDANQSVQKKIADSLGAVKQNDELVKIVQESTQNVNKLQEAVTTLTAEIRTREQNKLEHLAIRTGALADEIKNLGSMILTAASSVG